MTTSSPSTDRGPGITFPPPFIFIIAMFIGSVLQRVVPLPLPIGNARVATLAGVTLIVIGVALALTGILTFRRFRTAIIPHKPATQIVDAGVYAHTRNPMYSGLTIAYVGFALWIATWWLLLLLPIVLAIIITKVIRREEQYLMRAFPTDYADYCSRVRRWI